MKLIKKVSLVLLTLIMIILVVSIINFKLLKNDYLFKYKISLILSGSMNPVLKINDLVLIKETDNYSVGDIIVFKNDTSETIHRIKEIEDDYVITKGDANNTEDAPVLKNQITGKYVCTIPFVGSIVSFIRKGNVFIFLISTIICTFIYFVLKDNNKI